MMEKFRMWFMDCRAFSVSHLTKDSAAMPLWRMLFGYNAVAIRVGHWG
jgi:hypothetical protein